MLWGRAAEDPDAPAILAPGRKPLTYAGLQAQIEATVEALNRMGLGRSDRVALVLPNGPEMAVAFLAVSACATCAPLNPAYRAREFEFYLSDLGVHALVAAAGRHTPARQVAQSLGIPVLELEPREQAEAGLFRLTGQDDGLNGHDGFAQPEDVALVLHTSGTTSRPKIVPLTHTNLCVSARHILSTLQLTSNDRCLNIAPLFHIHGLMAAVMASLSAGGSVVCTPGAEAPRFFQWMAEARPTWYTAVPTMHQAILARATENRSVIARVPLRFVRSSSASLPRQVLEDLERCFGAPVIEAYGMTEAAHQMTSNPLPPGVRKVGSVGPPAGPEVAIMDDGGRLLPAEAVGEIVIRGPNVMRGYERNLQANQDAFTDGWFRTGDEGRMDEDGYLFITGRLKEMINRGGEKVSPREVDEVLMEHPAVAQAVAFALQDARLGEDVAAAVVLKDSASATERELREFTAGRLADFKVPRRVLVVNEIPKGPTGKLQRIGLAEKLGLRAEAPTAPTGAAEFVAPRTFTEKKLAAIWQEVLGVERVGINDSFLALGGSSLLMTRVVWRVKESMRVELPLISFFEEASTIAGQARLIESLQQSGMREDP
jgi:acyl-CoA synthetase (AMP-forming)/AMP-acid ligase II/acyl carrier protein